jgi:hypothetical protein
MPAAALAVHGLFVVRLDTAGWLWRPTKTSGGRGPSAVERYLTAFGHSEITEFYQSTTHSMLRNCATTYELWNETQIGTQDQPPLRSGNNGKKIIYC